MFTGDQCSPVNRHRSRCTAQPAIGGRSRLAHEGGGPAFRPVRLLILILMLMAMIPMTACVRHQASVVPALVPAQAMDAGVWSVGGITASGPVRIDSAMPIGVHADQWWRDARGPVHRAVVTVTTARPVWQRFALDLLADAMPIDAVVTVSAAAMPLPVTPISAATLAAAARAAGYASP